MKREALEKAKARILQKYGPWSTEDIPLRHGIWTRGNLGRPKTRLKRVLQIIQDLSGNSVKGCRVLDLGCLEGQFAIELALHGAKVVAIEGRKANIEKARFAQKALGLKNIRFVQDDVRHISPSKYGRFDIILASGILYHLPVTNVCSFIERLFEMTRFMAVIDTHVSLSPMFPILYHGKHYHGRVYWEHRKTDDEKTKEGRSLRSLDNETSFWLTRTSLMNLLYNVGFTSLYECFNPPIKHCKDRCTFVAIKGRKARLKTSPAANSLDEAWEEGELSYPIRKFPHARILKKILLSRSSAGLNLRYGTRKRRDSR